MMKKSYLKKILPEQEPVVIPGKHGAFLCVCEPSLSGKELKFVTECIRGGWISSRGSYLERFEREYCLSFDSRYAVACSSGTAALHLALAAIGIKAGDEVIIPAFTMIATANAVAYFGARPVFVDADSSTWNIDVKKIEGKITKRTKAIMPVHTYGLPADMEPILRLAKKYKLFVIEDAAQAHGAEYKGRKIGGIGDITCFSLYANKIITTGEGGIATTNNKNFADKMALLRAHAFTNQRHFWHSHLGYNYKMTNMQAAIGCAQLERLNSLVEARIKNARCYEGFLKNVRGIQLPPESARLKSVYWMYSILVNDDFGVTRNALRAHLAKKGVETRPFFIPIHLQPLYAGCSKEQFPVAEQLCQRGINLPSAPTLKKSEIKYIAECIKSSVKK